MGSSASLQSDKNHQNMCVKLFKYMLHITYFDTYTFNYTLITCIFNNTQLNAKKMKCSSQYNLNLNHIKYVSL